jgi:uncharacterized lipoprotein
MIRTNSLLALILLSSTVLLLSGCGEKNKLCAVSGKVTFQGKPVAAGIIRFSNSQAGVDLTALLQSDGNYEIVTAQGPGLPEATYQVAIMPPRNNIPLGPMTQTTKPQDCRDIPEKYRLPSTSGLTMTVSPNHHRFDVDMR